MPPGLIPALTDWQHNRHGWALDPAHVLRAPNALNALAIAVSLFSRPGNGVIVQPPVFFDFFDVIRDCRRKVVENPLLLRDGRYGMDFDGLEALARRPENRILFLCNPHNPVGRVWSAGELSRLAGICARHEVLVVSDELHGDLVFSGHVHTPFASLGAEAAANSVTCLSPAKSFNIAGCCSAFTVVPDDARRDVFKRENARLTVNKNNVFASVAMEAAWRHGAPWLDAVTAYLEANLALLSERIESLPGVRLIKPEGTFLAWLDFRQTGLSPEALNAFLRERAGWAVTRGVAFGVGGAGFARLNFACPQARLAAALDDLQAALTD